MGFFKKLKSFFADDGIDKYLDTAEFEEKKRETDAKHGLYTVQSDGGVWSKQEVKIIQDICEQLVDATCHIEDLQREYQLVTKYLTDIQRIEELPKDMMREIEDNARKIQMLDDSRQTYLKSENLLSMDEFNRISAFEADVPDTIKNLCDMEMRDSMLKSDMAHLEGEKEDLKYMRKEYSQEITRIRGIIIAVLSIFLVTGGVLLAAAIVTKSSMTVYALVAGALAVLSFAVVYVRYLTLRNGIKRADKKLKRAISLLNKVKVKFINNTNTLEYVYQKYCVNSSKELEFQWDLYNRMVRDALKYSQASSDYKIYCDELVEKLAKIGVVDPLVWPKQVKALIDHREMVEIKHSLNVRRQNLREKIMSCDKIRYSASTALNASVEAEPDIEGFIKEFMSTYNMEFEKQ